VGAAVGLPHPAVALELGEICVAADGAELKRVRDHLVNELLDQLRLTL